MEKPFQAQSFVGPHAPESPRSTLERYLLQLDLSVDDLKDKSILDVGAEAGYFAHMLKKEGITEHIVSVDKYGPDEQQMSDSSLVIANAQKLPFANNSFDYVFSVSALPHIAHTGMTDKNLSIEERDAQATQLIAEAVRECLRVVKDNGQIRFGGLPNEIKPFVVEGMNLGLEGRGEIIEDGGSRKEKLYVLRKRADLDSNIAQ